MGVRRFEVEIGELVLHGFADVDGPAVAASLERALGSQLERAGADFGRSRSVERLDAPPIVVGAGTSARALGAAVAGRLHGSLRP
jgi:hypothetical protein